MVVDDGEDVGGGREGRTSGGDGVRVRPWADGGGSIGGVIESVEGVAEEEEEAEEEREARKSRRSK